MKRYLITFLTFFIITTNVFAQRTGKLRANLVLYFEEYGFEYNIPKLNDTVYYRSNDSTFKMIFKSWKGSCYFEYRKSGLLMAKGYFMESLGVLSRYRVFNFSKSNKKTVQIVSYYQPLKNGVWGIWSGKDAMLINKIFDEGVEVN